MCARTYVKTQASVLAQLFSATTAGDIPTSYNIAPTDPIPVVRLRPKSGERELVTTRWGLVPPWSKDIKGAARCINARAETVHEKPSFRSAFRKRRCLVVVDGFFEWRKEGKKRIPFAIHRPDDQPLAFAGLWELWRGGPNVDDSDIRHRSSTIITCAANADMENLHDRMPVILDDDAQQLWMSDTADEPALLDLLQPAQAGSVELFEVDPAVNNVRAEGAQLIQPVQRLL